MSNRSTGMPQLGCLLKGHKWLKVAFSNHGLEFEACMGCIFATLFASASVKLN